MMRTKCMLVMLVLLMARPNSGHAEFTPVSGWDSQLFPSYLIATASTRNEEDAPDNVLGDFDGQLGVTVEAQSDDEKIQVTILCDEYLEVSQWSGRLPTAGESYTIYPKIRYRFDKLAKCTQATPATVTFRVKQGDAAVEEIAQTITVRSINDCPFKIIEGDETINTSFTFAAYVNEQHPFVDKLLREALDRGMVDKFDGYQSGDHQQVIRQVYALWDLLVARDVRYSSITTTAVASQNIACQHVRLIEETANNSQANCVDGSVLFVSMLRKIGISAALVLQPTHCYVAFNADAEGKLTFGLETTLMGAAAEVPDDVPELLDEAVAEDERDEYSWASFTCALKRGAMNMAENDQNAENPDYEIVNISRWRAVGVLPIPFTGREKFVAYDHSAAIEYDTDEATSEEDWESEEEEEEEEEIDEDDA